MEGQILIQFTPAAEENRSYVLSMDYIVELSYVYRKYSCMVGIS